jgi:hypothetical protein
MSALPLFHVSGPEQHVAWRNGQPVSAAQFLTDVRALAGQLRPGRSVLNVCADRYLFAVGFAAALTIPPPGCSLRVRQARPSVTARPGGVSYVACAQVGNGSAWIPGQ